MAVTVGSNKVNVIVPTGMPGPKGDTGAGVAVQGTYSGTNTPLPVNPVEGDMWIIGTPIPTLTPPRPGPAPAEPGDGMIWNGSEWVNTGAVQGPQGVQGVQGVQGDTGADSTVPGPPGIVMSPDPPTVTTLLWADTDEEGTGGSPGTGTGGGVSAVFAHYTSPYFGISAAKGATVTLKYDDVAQGTATALPAGWHYGTDGTHVGVTPGVYSFHLAWEAPDQYWFGKILGGYLYTAGSILVQFNSGAPVLDPNGIWYGAASGTATLHNSEGRTGPGLEAFSPSPWFIAYLVHGSGATATNAAKWTFNVTRLGDIPP